MKKYIHYDNATGKILYTGVCDKKTFETLTDVIEGVITNENYVNLGTMIPYYLEPEYVLTNAQKIKNYELYSKLGSLIAAISPPWGGYEEKAWNIMVREASDFNHHSSYATPFIDALILGTSIVKATFCTDILTANSTYCGQIGALHKIYKELTDAVMAATTQAELDAITWP